MEPGDRAYKAATQDFRSKLSFFNSNKTPKKSSQKSAEPVRRGQTTPKSGTTAYQASAPGKSTKGIDRSLSPQQCSPIYMKGGTASEYGRPVPWTITQTRSERKSTSTDRRSVPLAIAQTRWKRTSGTTYRRFSHKFDDDLRAKMEEVSITKSSCWNPNDMEVFKRPMCLVSSEASNVLKIETETIAQIEKIDWPMVVVSVVGLYRTGKSYLMNRLADSTKEGFALGDTIESKTKGIWVWCKIHPKMSNTVLLLLDTEGLGDVDKGDPSHDNKIFTMATLLCNCLVYNMKGAFDQDAVNKLTFVTEMAKNIRYRGESSEDNKTLNLILPDFVLCLRDFSLKLLRDGKQITEDEYLEQSLAEQTGKDEKFNKPRECIRRYFPKRKCFTLPVPGDGDVLENLETLQFSDLSVRFKEATIRFISYIYSKKPKELQTSKPVNGRMFATLTINYVTAIKHGAVPDVDDAFSAVAKIENKKAGMKALEIFETQMRTIGLPVSEVVLGSYYTKAQQTALHYLRENVVHDKDGQCETESQMKMDNIWNKIKEDNSRKVRVMCDAKLQEMYKKSLKGKIENGAFEEPGGYRKYQRDMELLKEEYFSTLRDFEEHQILGTWLGLVSNLKGAESKIIQSDDAMSQKEKDDEKRRNKDEIENLKKEQQNALKEALEQQRTHLEDHYNNLTTDRMKQIEKDHAKELKLVEERLEKKIAQEEVARLKREKKAKESRWIGGRIWDAIWNK